ncbi:hypothetical protein H0H81_003576 [Sphagnurus paluster]|uniref:Uncharacterized protein n=1 Tax=Sphagnurus paluster TaxID=117069 RepID=A0A9P7GTE6_9AGAR|nr:hypothetical protein H0H81_003576 [Sphagnurus paluster]
MNHDTRSHRRRSRRLAVRQLRPGPIDEEDRDRPSRTTISDTETTSSTSQLTLPTRVRPPIVVSSTTAQSSTSVSTTASTSSSSSPPIIPIVLPTTSPASSSTSQSTSSSSSTSPVSTPSSIRSPVVLPTSAPTSQPTTAADRAIPSTPSSSQPDASGTAVPAQVASGAISTGALGGIIGGSIAGAGLIILIIILLIVSPPTPIPNNLSPPPQKRQRKKSLENIVFNADQFRRSANLLNDPPTPPEKSPEQKVQQQQAPRRPRPPTIIEQHLRAPAVPHASAAVPYSEHAPRVADPYGHYAASAAQYNVGMYGADGQVARDPYADVYGASNPTGAAYGQYPAYGQGQGQAYGAPPPPQYQQYQQYQQQQYQQPQRQYPGQFQGSFVPGQVIPGSRTATPQPQGQQQQQSNPFASPARAKSASALTAARAAAATPVPRQYVNRQGSLPLPGGAPAAHNEPPARYADVQRAANDDSRLGTPTQHQRSPSSQTMYDQDDAYGGI